MSERHELWQDVRDAISDEIGPWPEWNIDRAADSVINVLKEEGAIK